MKVLLTGGTGQVGKAVLKVFERRGIIVESFGRDVLDLGDLDKVRFFLNKATFTHVVHSGAFTGVDRAEVENKACFDVNAEATGLIARACEERNGYMLYISSDYAIGGSGEMPLLESEECVPRSVYGCSKLLGEKYVREYCRRSVILRTSWVFGDGGKNFLGSIWNHRTGAGLRIVEDQVGAPTYAGDLAEIVCAVMEHELRGIYNAAADGYCSWADLAEYFFDLLSLKPEIERVSTAEYGGLAERPLNSRLCMDRLKRDLGYGLPHWKNGVKRFVIRDGFFYDY